MRKILATYAIPIVEIDGEEADDVIATLARQAEEAQQDVLVVTGDLDLLQIVDERTTVLTTRRGITDLGRYDEEKVRERFDLEPRQLPDYRGLKGDPSDNLPGIPGVGEKTAIKLVKAAGSLDALLADPALAGTPKLEALIRAHGETARICRDVSVIKRDLPLSLDWESARYTPPSNDALYALYRELEFKTLLAKLAPPANAARFRSEEVLHGRLPVVRRGSPTRPITRSSPALIEPRRARRASRWSLARRRLRGVDGGRRGVRVQRLGAEHQR